MKYFPILLSKAGEFKALKELNATVKTEISPIIEIIPESIERVQANLISDWNFNGNQIILDFCEYGQIGAPEILIIEQLFNNLLVAGVNAIPAVQENNSHPYLQFVRTFAAQRNVNICVKASNNGGGLINFNTYVSNLINQLGVTANRTTLHINLGYAQDHNYNNLSALAINILNGVQDITQWNNVIVSAGSFPVDLTHLSANTVHRLRRFEWDIWNTINANANLRGNIKYGDYGNKNPVYGGEGGYAGSCSIKYTTANEFVIYRGIKAEDHPLGNGQYITFAGRLIQSPIYSGVNFSWGDASINRIAHEPLGVPNARRVKPGSATTWVEITQNHHITLLHQLL